MKDDPTNFRSWYLAGVIVLAAAPWPAFSAPASALVVAAAVLTALARPARWEWLPWSAAWLAVLLAVVSGRGGGTADQLESALDAHCSGMQTAAERLAGDTELRGLFAASGETLDPTLPFRRLDRAAAGVVGRTIYLADDRSRVVAWGGAQQAFPEGVRALGERRWLVGWSASEATLILREPVFLDGHLVGALVVADHSPLEVSAAFGMRAPPDSLLSLGHQGPAATVLVPQSAAGVQLPVSMTRRAVARTAGTAWLPLLLFTVSGLVICPLAGVAGALVGGLLFLFVHGGESEAGLAVVILIAGFTVNRIASLVPPKWSKFVVGTGFLALVVTAAFALNMERGSWLPDRLLRPSWGGVWMIAAAWAAAGWPQRSYALGRRLALSFVLATTAVVMVVARLPAELLRVCRDVPPLVVPVGDIDINDVLPAASDSCELGGVASVLAEKWRLGGRHPPSELRLIDDTGRVISRWGDLSLAGDARVIEREWEFASMLGASLELSVATEPWSSLRDWHSKVTSGRGLEGPVGFVVFTRSGEVEATLLSNVRDLDPVTAGELYHGDGGWTFIQVGESSHLAHIRRQGDRLVAGVALYWRPSELVVRAAVAVLWAFLGFGMARPPRFRRGQIPTFGGRLRLLVGGGVVFPLVVLSLFLQPHFSEEEERREQAAGNEALHSARYTAAHLSGGFAVDDELAAWVAGGLGGEVALFDGVTAVAVSRRDLLGAGVLPELPPAEAFTTLLLGREITLVSRQGDHLLTAGPVELQGRRLLLVLSRPEPREDVEAPGVVDWLLTGAVLAALFALVFTSRVERRLSVSLDELGAISRRLLDGEPIGDVRQPREADLAEVFEAVRAMYEGVQEREISLRRQEELLRIALSTLAPAVMVLDLEHEIRFANPAAERLRAEHGDLIFDSIATLSRRCQEENGPVTETVSPLPGQELTWRMGVAGAPLPDGSSGLVAVVDDITDVVRIDRLRQLNQMARIVAHEVKNPLTPIRLWVQELIEARNRRSPEFDALLDEACTEISEQVGRLQDMAGSFSNLAALERWEPNVVDLVQVVEDVVGGLAVLGRRGIDVQLEVPEHGICLVVGDRQWLRRALGNLFMNSIAAIGDESGVLGLKLVRDDTKVVLEIEDSGGGVLEDQLSDLFSPHFSTTTSGSGLGLALVHNVVARCQGKVSASNSANGLVVRLEFPRTLNEG